LLEQTCGQKLMTSNFSACNVTVANSNYKNSSFFSSWHCGYKYLLNLLVTLVVASNFNSYSSH